MLLNNNEWVKTKVKEEIKVSGNKWRWTHNNPKPMGHSKGTPEREVHIDTGLPKEDSKISNKQPNPTSTSTRGTTTNKGQSEQNEGNNQDKSRIKWHRDNKFKESMNPGAGSLKRETK